MRKLGMITLGAVMALALAGDAYAQTGTISATATVNTVFTTENTQNLSFDAVDPGTAASVSVTDGTGGTRGYVEFAFNANYQIVATALPTTLTHTSESSATLTAAWTCATSSGTGTNPGSGTACSQGGTVGSASSVTSGGTVVVWLGGSIANTTNALAGTYTTGNAITFTISAN